MAGDCFAVCLGFSQQQLGFGFARSPPVGGLAGHRWAVFGVRLSQYVVSVRGLLDPPSVVVDLMVAATAQQTHVVDVRGSSCRPWHHMVRLAPSWVSATAHTPSVAGDQRHALSRSGGPFPIPTHSGWLRVSKMAGTILPSHASSWNTATGMGVPSARVASRTRCAPTS